MKNPKEGKKGKKRNRGRQTRIRVNIKARKILKMKRQFHQKCQSIGDIILHLNVNTDTH